MPQILDDEYLDSFVPLLVILMCNYSYIANPYLVAKLVEVNIFYYKLLEVYDSLL